MVISFLIDLSNVMCLSFLIDLSITIYLSILITISSIVCISFLRSDITGYYVIWNILVVLYRCIYNNCNIIVVLY